MSARHRSWTLELDTAALHDATLVRMPAHCLHCRPTWTRFVEKSRAMGVIGVSSLLPRHRVTMDEYLCMAEAGVLPPDAGVEPIDGETGVLP
jgi:hypothetical protein